MDPPKQESGEKKVDVPYIQVHYWFLLQFITECVYSCWNSAGPTGHTGHIDASLEEIRNVDQMSDWWTVAYLHILPLVFCITK